MRASTTTISSSISQNRSSSKFRRAKRAIESGVSATRAYDANGALISQSPPLTSNQRQRFPPSHAYFDKQAFKPICFLSLNYTDFLRLLLDSADEQKVVFVCARF